jgi:hypothetical protein
MRASSKGSAAKAALPAFLAASRIVSMFREYGRGRKEVLALMGY